MGVVALPLALAFGVSSGVGAEAGLITAVVAGIVGAIFGGSPVQVSGPTGAMVVVLLPLVAQHGSGSVVVVTVAAGVVLLVASVLKFGRLIGFIPWPVIEGFTAGIGVIIFLQQLPAAIAVTASTNTNTLFATVDVVGRWASGGDALQSLLVVGVVVVVMMGLPRLTTTIPASIVAIVIATALAMWGNFTTATIGTLPNSLPSPEFPAMDANVLMALAPSVLAVAALAAIESLLSARVASTLSGNTAYQPDRELFGQGLASVIAGLFGGMPATGAIARTAVNVKSGARTRLASITHGIVLLAVIYWGTTLVADIPVAALAGVLMVTAIRMIPVRAANDIFRSTRSDAIVFIATAVVTISFDLIEAVAIGILATAFFALRSMVASSGIHREEIPAPHTELDQHVALFRLDGALFFGAAESMLSRLSTIDNVRVVVLRMAGLQFLDATGAHVLVDISTALENRGIHVILKGIRLEHRGLITRMGLPDSVDIVETLDEALALARAKV
ncbi:MAG: hypothetical protein RJA31_640 [Actinomycetota bacterium]